MSKGLWVAIPIVITFGLYKLYGEINSAVLFFANAAAALVLSELAGRLWGPFTRQVDMAVFGIPLRQ